MTIFSLEAMNFQKVVCQWFKFKNDSDPFIFLILAKN